MLWLVLECAGGDEKVRWGKIDRVGVVNFDVFGNYESELMPELLAL